MKSPVQKIPYLNTPDTPLIAPSQNLVPIADVIDNIVLFKNGAAALVLESTSLNFGLLSEREQEAVIAAYAALINSLSFPMQIVVQTHKKDVSSYIDYLKEFHPKVENQALMGLMESYIEFISEIIKKRNVLEKSFYIIIPFSQYELGIGKAFQMFGPKKSEKLPYTKAYILKKAHIALTPKRDHLTRQAARLGLKLRQLENDDLIKLYYSFYNPDPETVKVEEKVDSI